MSGARLTLDPVVLAMLVLGVGLYVRAVRILARRGFRVSRWQQASWYLGLLLTAVALVSPIDALGEDLLSMHMLEHLLIADIAAPFLLVGLRTPVLVFLLPRPALLALARRPWLRRAFRTVRQPLVAIPVFVLVLYGWHFRAAFQGALEHPGIHALQHASFVGISLLVWWSVLEPKKRRMPGDLWKIGHIFAARLASMMLGMAFVFMRVQAYPFYGERAREHGLTPLHDQQLAGGMMMVLDILVIVTALTLFFWRTASDYDREQDAERRAADRDEQQRIEAERRAPAV